MTFIQIFTFQISEEYYFETAVADTVKNVIETHSDDPEICEVGCQLLSEKFSNYFNSNI